VILTFGYGSNKCFRRMKRRVASLEFVAVGVLDNYSFVMNKLSKDGSAKGNIKADKGRQVFGVVYSLSDADLDALNRWEGVGDGYVLNTDLEVCDLAGHKWEQPVLVYVGDHRYLVDGVWPYNWYTRHIVEGARHYALPADYIEWLELHPASEDPDRLRDAQERMYPCDRPLTQEERGRIWASRRQNPDV
jgi:gamma-glutamylcyclotransferase